MSKSQILQIAIAPQLFWITGFEIVIPASGRNKLFESTFGLRLCGLEAEALPALANCSRAQRNLVF